MRTLAALVNDARIGFRLSLAFTVCLAILVGLTAVTSCARAERGRAARPQAALVARPAEAANGAHVPGGFASF